MRIVETKHADLRREKRRHTNSDGCPAALEGATCDAVATDVKARASCFPREPYNDWISVHKAVFSGGTRTTTRCFDDDDDDDARGGGGGGGRGGRHESNDDERNVRVRAGHAAAAIDRDRRKRKSSFIRRKIKNVDKSETGEEEE